MEKAISRKESISLVAPVEEAQILKNEDIPDKIRVKDDLGKLTDSACESLNESEDSGSKYQDNVTGSCSGFVSDEKDSLGCEDDPDLSESDNEEESADNNTFNVNNTENSESQEISELTNEENSTSEDIKENDNSGDNAGSTELENNSCSNEISITSDESVNVSSEKTTETSSESFPNSNELKESSIEDDLIGSVEDHKENCKSNASDDSLRQSEDILNKKMENKVPPADLPEGDKVNPLKINEEKVDPNRSRVALHGNSKSPKIRKKLMDSNASKVNKNDFIVEIFESKRKTVTTEGVEEHSTKDIKEKKSDSEKQSLIISSNDNNDSDFEKCSDSPQSSEKLMSDPMTLTLETASPDSIDKNSSLLLDISQPIKEESEQSDDLSPIKSLAEDNSNEIQDLTEDTSKKIQHQESPKTTPPPDLNLKSPSSFSGKSVTTPTKTPLIRTSCNSSASRNDCQASPSGSSEGASKKPNPMAFTVELGDSAASDSSGSVSTGKKLDISTSISQWVPKHRRNLSLTKVEENKKVEERQSSEKPPIGRPRSGTVGAGSLGLRKGGYHSEGYFSSDQDEDGPKKTELKSPRSPKTLSGENQRPALVTSPSQDSTKGNAIRMRPPSPASSPYGVPLNESASYLIERIMNTPETKRKQIAKTEGRSCCKERERKPSVSELTGKTSKIDKSKMGTDSKKQMRNTPTEDLDPLRDDKDDVSETGTYTIDKDSPSPEIEQARSDIDRVFGIATESEAELTSSTAIPMSTTDQCQEDESSWLSASEVTPAISRNSPNWIHQWAAQVAEQTKPPVVEAISPSCKASLSSSRGHKLPVTPQESPEIRPRRKLPSVPSHLSSSHQQQRVIDTSDSETLKPRLWKDSTLNNDQTSDSEGFLRDTENLVTSLQARVNKSKAVNPAYRNSSFESHESCGDSDIDTSTSYPFNEEERLSTSIRNKLKLTGLHQLSTSLHSPSGVSSQSPRRPDCHLAKDTRVLNREATYDLFQNRREELPIQSDSSSETSDPYKDIPSRPPSDNNPPLKFNRAFSLRRARLGCDDAVVTNDKKKSSRPSSAGASTSTRTKTPLGATKSYQSVDNPSVSSPRGYGLMSPRANASSSVNSGSKGLPSSDSFDRTDGGRFSLRLPRAGSSPIGIVKSPSKSSLRKEPSKKNSHRSNSTLTSKEVDFQNWKRRKNYDPMKAAAEGRKKQVDKKKVEEPMPTSNDERANSSLLRSASFHGTEGMMANAKWNRKHTSPQQQPQYTSEDDGPYSLEEDLGPHPSPRHGSPLHRSTTSPHQLCPSPARQKCSSSVRGRRPSLGLSEEAEAQYQMASSRKISLDESGSEGKRSPLHQGIRLAAGNGSTSGSTGRPKAKMEALDNLVISTIHSLSSKVRTTSESLLQKLKSQYHEEGDRAALLEEVLSHLSESDQSSGQTRSTSRELSGILRNLKKIEHALGVIDRVIIVGDDDYPEDEDLLDEVPQDWMESDY